MRLLMQSKLQQEEQNQAPTRTKPISELTFLMGKTKGVGQWGLRNFPVEGLILLHTHHGFSVSNWTFDPYYESGLVTS
jgi:hypothetical protein